MGWPNNRYFRETHTAKPRTSLSFPTIALQLERNSRRLPASSWVATKVVRVAEKYGKAQEREAWIAKDFQSWIGLNDAVHWWGAVGITGSPDGMITHVFIHEKEDVLDSVK